MSLPPNLSRPRSPRRANNIRLKHLGALLCALLGLSLVPFASMRAATPTNLLSANSSSIETSAAGWTAQGNSSISRSTAAKYVGRASLRVLVAKAGYVDSSRTARVGTALVPATAGTTYKGLARVRPGGDRSPVRCELRWYDANGNIVSTYEGAPFVQELTGKWVQTSCEAKAPSGARSMALRVFISQADYGDVHYIDDAWLTSGATAPAPTTTTTTAPNNFTGRINSASGNDLVAPDGTKFMADSGYVGGSGTGNVGSTIAGTDNDALYVKHRWGMSGYSVPIPTPGTYTVRLHFAETVFTTSGQRVFDVSAEGTIRQNDLDVFAAAGADTALVRQFDVPVSDGNLNLGFTAVVEDPMISGIEVLGTTAGGPTTTTTAPATSTTGAPATTTTAPPSTTTTTAPAPPPSPGGYPNASNTGPSGALAPSGSITTSANGQVIQNLDINGEIRVQHNNVTIRNVRIRSYGQAISILGNTGLLVEDCELDGNNADSAAAIGDHNYTMRRCEVYRHGEGPRINGDVVLEDNYFHTFPSFIAQGAHQDCIQITSGSNIVIRHNTCMMNVDGGNAAIMTGSYSGNNLLFENNLLAGGGYTVYCGDNQYTNVTVRNNRFSTAYYPRGGYHGPFVYCSQASVSGNVWHDGPNAGQPAN